MLISRFRSLTLRHVLPALTVPLGAGTGSDGVIADSLLSAALGAEVGATLRVSAAQGPNLPRRGRRSILREPASKAGPCGSSIDSSSSSAGIGLERSGPPTVGEAAPGLRTERKRRRLADGRTVVNRYVLALPERIARTEGRLRFLIGSAHSPA